MKKMSFLDLKLIIDALGACTSSIITTEIVKINILMANPDQPLFADITKDNIENALEYVYNNTTFASFYEKKVLDDVSGLYVYLRRNQYINDIGKYDEPKNDTGSIGVSGTAGHCCKEGFAGSTNPIDTNDSVSIKLDGSKTGSVVADFLIDAASKIPVTKRNSIKVTNKKQKGVKRRPRSREQLTIPTMDTKTIDIRKHSDGFTIDRDSLTAIFGPDSTENFYAYEHPWKNEFALSTRAFHSTLIDDNFLMRPRKIQFNNKKRSVKVVVQGLHNFNMDEYRVDKDEAGYPFIQLNFKRREL